MPEEEDEEEDEAPTPTPTPTAEEEAKEPVTTPPEEEEEDDEGEEEPASTPSPSVGSEEDEEEEPASPPSSGVSAEEEDGAGEGEAMAGSSALGADSEDDDGDMVMSDAPVEPDEEGASGAASGSGGGEGDVDPNMAASVNWGAIDKESKNDYDETLSRMISDATTDAAKHSDYLIYTKDQDVVEPLHVGREYNGAMLTRLQDSCDHMVAPLQKDLERAIAARSLSQYSAGHRSGRLHAANLARLAVGDDRVFRRKHETTSKDVAVELVVDASGSMSGSKINTAAQAAYALASVLERIGISCEVICFTTGEETMDSGKMAEEMKKLGRKYSRVESLYMPILKGFDERMGTEVKKRFGWLPNSNILRNNVDGECVEIAARRLMARRETGKIMMVLSDGAPSANGDYRSLSPHLKKVVADITKAGVNVIGIGIESEAVQQFYPKYLTINDVKDLPKVVMQELRALILK